MKLIVLSDSHGLKQPLAYIRSTYEDADCIIHCGDICLPKEYAKGMIVVAGNCDNPAWYPNGEIIVLENHRILILHGHVLFSSSFVNKMQLYAVQKETTAILFSLDTLMCTVMKLLMGFISTILDQLHNPVTDHSQAT